MTADRAQGYVARELGAPRMDDDKGSKIPPGWVGTEAPGFPLVREAGRAQWSLDGRPVGARRGAAGRADGFRRSTDLDPPTARGSGPR